jgi:hypothetical protein
MNDPRQTEASFESNLNIRRVASIFGFFAVIGFAAYLYYGANNQTRIAQEEAAAQASENAKLQMQMANLESALSDLKTAKVYERQEQAITKSNALSILERGEIAKQDILRFSDARNKLNDKMNEVYTSDVGRRIASDVMLVAAVSQTLSIAIPNENTAPTLLARLEALLSVPKQAMEQNIAGYKPGESLNSAFGELEKQCKEAQAIVDRVASDLSAITRKATELPVNRELDLRQALSSLEEIKEQQRSALIAQARDDAKLEGAKVLAAQEVENERLLTEAKARAAQLAGAQMAEKIVADAQAEKVTQDAERKAQQAMIEKAKLEQDFQKDLPEIRNYLTNYLSDGYELRGGGKGPASLRALRGTPIFEPGRRGLEAIIHYASNRNDRPRGPIEPETGGDYGWKIANKDVLTKVQSLLTKYGELLVEKGMLAP